jgi:hypothetical protein
MIKGQPVARHDFSVALHVSLIAPRYGLNRMARAAQSAQQKYFKLKT